MTEYRETYGNHKLLCYKPVSDGDHIIQVGEDIRKTECILRKGQKICARHIGTLAALGISEISVYTMPDIAIISTGDELVDLTQKRLASQIYDVNFYALAASALKAAKTLPKKYCPNLPAMCLHTESPSNRASLPFSPLIRPVRPLWQDFRVIHLPLYLCSD